MTECDAFNLIDEYIKQSCCPDTRTGSTPALTSSDYSFSTSGRHETCSKSSPNQTSTYNTFSSSSSGSNKSSTNSDRTSESSYESALELAQKSGSNKLVVYNEDAVRTVQTTCQQVTSELEQIYVSLNMSKALSYEHNVFLTPPRSERFEETLHEEHNFLDDNENTAYGDGNNLASVQARDLSCNLSQEYQTIPTIKPPTGVDTDGPDMFTELYPQKPKRPYSYYAATNFHPLDLTLFNESSAGGDDKTTSNLNNTSINEDSVGVVVKKRTKRTKQRGEQPLSKLEMSNRRLSTSLGDLVKIDTAANKLEAKDKSKSSSQNHLERQSRQQNEAALKSSATLKKSNRSRSANRLNKFIRNIFKHKHETAAVNSDTEESADIIDQHNQTATSQSNGNTNHNSAFTRLFNSFRTSHGTVNGQSKRFAMRNVSKQQRNRNSSSARTNSSSATDDSLKTLQVNGTDSSTLSDTSQDLKKELKVMDVQPSKQQRQQPLLPNLTSFFKKPQPEVKISQKSPEYSSSQTSTGYGSASSTSPVSADCTELEQMRLKFYIDIANRLKHLSAENVDLKEKASNKKQPLKLSSFTIAQKRQSALIQNSFNVDDVPYIDEDLDSNYDYLEFSHTPIISAKKCNDQTRLAHQLYDKQVVQALACETVCVEAKFKQAICGFERFDMSEWHKVAGIFDLVLQTAKIIEAKSSGDEKGLEQTFKVKQAAANCIHEKFCDWIFEQGGWNAVPENPMLNINMKCSDQDERIL